MAKQIVPKYNDFRDGGYLSVWRVILPSKKLKPTEKLILSYLYFKTNKVTGWSWPSQATIGYALGLDKRIIRDTLKRLATKKLIEIKKHHAGRASGYKVNIDLLNEKHFAKLAKKTAASAASSTQTQSPVISSPSAPITPPDGLERILGQIRQFKSAYPKSYPNCVTAFQRKLEREFQWAKVNIDIGELTRLHGLHNEKLEEIVMSTFKE